MNHEHPIKAMCAVLSVPRSGYINGEAPTSHRGRSRRRRFKSSGVQTIRLWQVEVNRDPRADDGSRDVGRQIAVLVAASFYFLGKTSAGTRFVEVNKNEAAALLAAKGEVRSSGAKGNY